MISKSWIIFGCLISLRISISRVTLWTSASSVIFLFSKIFTATYNFIVNAKSSQEIIRIAYLLSSDVVRPELHLSKSAFTNVLPDDVVADGSVSWRRLRRSPFFVPCCTRRCLFTYRSCFGFLLRIWPFVGFRWPSAFFFMVLACLLAWLIWLGVWTTWFSFSVGVVTCRLASKLRQRIIQLFLHYFLGFMCIHFRVRLVLIIALKLLI